METGKMNKTHHVVPLYLVMLLVMIIGCDGAMDVTGPHYPGSAGMSQERMRQKNESEQPISTTRTRTIGLPFSQTNFDSRRNNGWMAQRYNEMFIPQEEGGRLTFGNGSLYIPPNSIDASKVIWSQTYMVRGNLLKNIYDFGPSGTTFNPPAELTLSYCNMGPVMPASLTLMLFNEETGEWEPAAHMTHDPATHTFTGPIYHFSRYSLSGNGQVLRPKTIR